MVLTCGNRSGAEGTRTPDPLHAMQVRYQLRHSPWEASISLPGSRPSSGVVAGLLLWGATGVVLLEPPAATDVAEERPPAVAQRCEPPPGVRRQVEERPDRRPRGAAMRHGDEQ